LTRAEIAPWPADPAAQRELLTRAAALIRSGEVVAFPTDTVYGIGVSAWDPEAIQRLYAIKGRPRQKAIALLLSGSSQLPDVTDYRSPKLDRLVWKFWPGALTIVVPWRASLRDRVPRESGTVGIRVPDHPVARALIAAVGVPLATTSANLSGAPSPVTAQEVDMQIGDRIALIIDGGRCPGGQDSTVVDLTTDPPTVRRVGAISVQELEAVLGPLTVEKVSSG